MIHHRWSVRCAAWLALVMLPLSLALSQPVLSGEAANAVQERMLADLKYLASDELEGRGVGTKGLDLAADYVRDQFRAAGLSIANVKGGAFQTFSMTTGSTLGTPNTLEFRGPDGKKVELELTRDFTPLSFGGSGPINGELVFCGYGIDSPDDKYNDFDGLDVTGKIVIVMRRTPQQSNPHSPFAGGHGGMSMHAELRTKISNAFGKGAAAVIFVNDPHSGRQAQEQQQKLLSKQAETVANTAEELEAADSQGAEQQAAAKQKLSAELAKYRSLKADIAKGDPDTLMKFGYGGDDSIRTIPLLHVSRASLDQVLKATLNKSLTELEAAIDKDLKPHSAALTGWTAVGQATIERKTAEVKNVIGVLEGEGPLAQETVIIGAHYDHVGRGGAGSLAPGSTEIHNGADDNASGTVSLIELARRLAARKDKLPRRVVFIAFTAEETGLIGSARYTKEPLFPLDKTIAMLNMDMVGRMTNDKLTIFGTGTSSVWPGLVEKLGKDLQFQLSLKPEGFGPSDHASFYGKQIPVLHFFSGNHNDYHRPTDDWDKINIAGTQKITDLIEQIAVSVATTSEKPDYVAVKGNANPLREGSRPYFGSIPDFSSDEPGYSLNAVAPGSPAEKGGLKGGDRIVQMGTQKIDNLNDFDLALRKFSAGDTVDVTIIRDKMKVVVKVTLDKPR